MYRMVSVSRYPKNILDIDIGIEKKQSHGIPRNVDTTPNTRIETTSVSYTRVSCIACPFFFFSSPEIKLDILFHKARYIISRVVISGQYRCDDRVFAWVLRLVFAW